MPDYKVPYLCGGVLFFLLAQAKAKKGTARDHKAGIKEDHRDPLMMADLVRAFTGAYITESKKDTSLYRECQSEGSINLPYNDVATAEAYMDLVRRDYDSAIRRICAFSRAHINPAMHTWLVKAWLETIDLDEGISDDEPFYVKADGTSMTKAELRGEGKYLFEPFLLGVLLFILAKRRERNYLGFGTLEAWGTKAEKHERRYTGHVGESITRDIQADSYTPSAKKATPPPEKEDEQDIEPAADEHDADSRQNETGFNLVAPDETLYTDNPYTADSPFDAAREAAEGKKITVIQHQTNVVQFGPNSESYTNNGTMTIIKKR